MKKCFLIILFIATYCDTMGQEAQEAMMFDSLNSYTRYNINLENIQLPPVSVFMEAANRYADIKYYDAKIDEELITLKQEKKSWLNYIRLQGNYQYGTTNAMLTQSGEQFPNGYGYASENRQSWYNVGAALSIPLDDLFSRKQKTGVIKARISQIEYEAERALENRQLIILEAYNEVVKQMSIIKVKAEAVALYNAQMKISENDFVKGKIDVISLSLERGRRADAIVRYQESRAALHNAVTLLEMLTKVKIIKN